MASLQNHSCFRALSSTLAVIDSSIQTLGGGESDDAFLPKMNFETEL